MTRRVVVDLDGTVADLCTTLLARLHERHGELLTMDQIKTWKIGDHAKTFKDDDVEAVLAEPGIFRHLRPYPGAIDALHVLSENGWEIIVASAAAYPTNFSEKAAWVHEHLPFITKRQFALIHEKHLLDADALIDDGPHNAEKFRQAHPGALITGIAFPYNTDCRAYSFLGRDFRDTNIAWQQIVNGLGKGR